MFVLIGVPVLGYVYDDIISYYPLQANTNDVVGNKHLINNGATLTSGATCPFTASCYDFDGNNDYMNQSVGKWFNATQDFSICLNVNSDDFTSQKEMVSQYKGGGADFYFGFGGGVGQDIRFSSTWADIDISSLSTGRDYYLCAVKDAGSNGYIYVNGSLFATKGSDVTFTATGDFGYLGRQGLLNSDYLNARLSNVVFFNKTLNSTEILQLYNDNGNPFTDVTIVNSSFVTASVTPTVWFNTTLNSTCSISYNGTVLGVNSSVPPNVNAKFVANTSLHNGTYNVTVTCTSGSISDSDSINVTVNHKYCTTSNDAFAYYNFDANGDDSSTRNYVLTGNEPSFVAGKINNMASFDGAADYYTNTSLVGLTGDISFNGWFNNADCTLDEFRIYSSVSSKQILRYEWKDNSGDGAGDGCDLRIEYHNDAGTGKATAWTDGYTTGLTMITVVAENSGNITIYQNGVKKSSVATDGGIRADGNTIQIGKIDALYFSTQIDEFGIWNRTLPLAEISGLYGDSVYGACNPFDVEPAPLGPIPPVPSGDHNISINILGPSNETINHTYMLRAKFGYNSTNGASANCSLVVRNTTVATRQNIANGTTNIVLNYTSMVDGQTYDWFINCSSYPTINLSKSGVREYTFDPIINFSQLKPANNTRNTTSMLKTSFNYTNTYSAGETGTCTLIIDAAPVHTGSVKNGTIGRFNATSMTDGTNHSWSVSCSSTTVSANSTATFKFLFDPNITIQINGPANESTNLTNMLQARFNYTNSMSEEGSCYLNINNASNTTALSVGANLTEREINSTGLVDGSTYDWFVNCFSAHVSNTNSSFYEFTFDPIINFSMISPANQTVNRTSMLNASFNYSNTYGEDGVCTLMIGSAVEDTTTITEGSIGRLNATNMHDGTTYQWSVNCSSATVTFNMTGEFDFTFDPIINFSSVMPANNTRNMTHMLEASAAYNNTYGETGDCDLLINGVVNVSGLIRNNGVVRLNASGLIYEDYNWSISCLSSHVDSNSTADYNYSFAPTLSIHVRGPANESTNTTNMLESRFYYNSTFAGSPVGTCLLYVNNVSNVSVSRSPSATALVVANSTGMSDGDTYDWFISCDDALSPRVNSSFYEFTFNPNITIVINSPVNNNVNNTQLNVSFSYENSYQGESGICSLVINNSINSSTPEEYCYQESANKSTVCGGLSTGVYSSSASFFDEDWTTLSFGNSYYYINYSINNRFNSAIWQIKTSSFYTNNTINSTCLDTASNKLILRHRNYHPLGVTYYNYFECYNDSEWVIVKLTSGGTYSDLYEEGIYWYPGYTIYNNSINNITSTALTDGLWNYTIRCNSTTVSNTDAAFRNYSMDTLPPTITWVKPSIANNTMVHLEFDSNITFFDYHFSNYKYNVTRKTGNLLLVNSSNMSITGITRYNLTDTINNFTAYLGVMNYTITACDTANNCKNESALFVASNSTTTTNTTRAIEYQPVSFLLNVVHDNATSSLTSVIFNYGTTAYSFNDTNVSWTANTSHVLINYTRRVPFTIASLNVNVTHNWTAIFSDGSSYSTNSSVLQTHKVKVDNCTLYHTQAINLTLKNLTSNATTIGDTVAYIPYSNYYGVPYNFSASMNNKATNYLCMYPSWSAAYSNMWINYSAAGIPRHQYFTYNTTLNGTMRDILLYFDTGLVTNVTFYVKDMNDLAVSNAYITILKFNPATAVYQTTEILRTDDDGKAIGNIVLDTVWYKFLITYEGVLYLETEPVIITTTPKTFRINFQNDYFAMFSNTRGVLSNLTYNNATQVFRFTYYDPAGTIHQGCMEVKRVRASGSTILDTSCVSSTASTITYTIAENVSDTTYIATGYVVYDEKEVVQVLWINFNDLWQTYGENGLFVSFIFIGVCMMVALWNPIIALVLTGIGLLLSSLPGFEILHFSSGQIVWIVIIMIGITVYKMGNKST